MRRGEDQFRSLGRDAPATEEADREGEDAERRHRLAARRCFRAAPPYRIQFEEDGTVSLCRKRYSYWGRKNPAAATFWTVISRHDDLEQAERRLRHITGPRVYYDERGRLAPAASWPDFDGEVPDDDEEDED